MTFSLAFYLTSIWLISAGIFGALLLAGEVGWRVGHAERKVNEALRTLVGSIAAAILAFLGLLLGFTLSMAISRFDARRTVIVDEANAIGTLWLRAGLLEPPLDAELRGALRDYTVARLDMGHVGTDLGRLRDARARSAAIQQTVWSVVERAATPGSNPAVVSALITAANEMIDLDELRVSSLENYVPLPLVLLLLGVAMVAVAFIGWSFGAASQRSMASMTLLALLLTSVLTVLMDFNRPHRGLIRVADQSLLRLQRTIGAPLTP